MATNSKIKADIQKLDVGSELVELFCLDASPLGGPVHYFTSMTDEGGSPVQFNGIIYAPLPVRITGMEITADGRLPRPKMEVSTVLLTFVALVNSYNDGVGCRVTRIRTFSKYIDGHAEADSNAQFPQDVFYIEQKTLQTKTIIEWELVSPLDIGNARLPLYQTTSYCCHTYRLYTGGSMSYDNATCPYNGGSYFKEDGSTTTIANDACGKKLSDCELRYPLSSDQLPFKGFPSIGQVGRAYR